MELIRCKNKEESLSLSAKEISKYFFETKEEILFLSSGGSSLAILDLIDKDALSSKITVSVLDTRIGVEIKDENYYQLTQTNFFKIVKEKGVKFLDISDLRRESVKNSGDRWNVILKDWLKKHPEAKIIATLGMGTDGHIAGIMPFPLNQNLFDGLFKSEEKLFVFYEAIIKIAFPKRLTATFSFLKKIDRVISCINGEDKKEKLENLLGEEKYFDYEFPGILIRDLKNVSIFTDIKI